jgi:hypothetical protein
MAEVAARERGQGALLEAGLDFTQCKAVAMRAHSHPQGSRAMGCRRWRPAMTAGVGWGGL